MHLTLTVTSPLQHNMHSITDTLPLQPLRFSRGRARSSNLWWSMHTQAPVSPRFGSRDLRSNVTSCFQVVCLMAFFCFWSPLSMTHTGIWHSSITEGLWWAILYLITPYARTFYTTTATQQADTHVWLKIALRSGMWGFRTNQANQLDENNVRWILHATNSKQIHSCSSVCSALH